MNLKCCDTHLSDNDIKDLLVEKGINRTQVKTKFIQILSKSKKPMSANELYHKIGATSCNISTVFRTITQFKEKGLIRETNLGEDFFRYEFINQHQEHDHHHHHVRCRDCGDIKFIEQCDLSIFEKLISKLGFKEIEHYLEFTGICSKCS